MSVSMKMQFEKPLHQTLLIQDAALWVAGDDALGLGCGAGSACAARPEPGAGILCRDTQGLSQGRHRSLLARSRPSGPARRGQEHLSSMSARQR